MPPRVEFDHVAFAYPTAEQVSLASLESVAVLDKRVSAQVLEDISFVVDPGQMVALVGPSGAGKTTITNLVARLYDVTGGAVRIGGHDVREVTLQSLHDAIGYVTQDAHMFHDTIRANLAYAKPDATDEEMIEALAVGADLGPGVVAARRPGHGRRRSRSPAVRRRTAAPGDRPVAAEGAAASSYWTRPPRTSTPSPRSPSSGRSTPRWRDVPRW